jgi:putative aldouronate transport system substrate-binding protein
MKKPQFSLMFSVVLILAMVLSACAPKAPSATETPIQEVEARPTATTAAKPTATTAAKPTATTAAKPTDTQAPPLGQVNPAGVFPIVNEKITLKVMIIQPPGVLDFVDNDFTKWLEEKTNIHLEFDVAPYMTEEATSKLNLVLASGQLPDVIIGFQVPLAQQQILADQKLFIPLDDLIEKYSVEFKTIMKNDPTIKKVGSLADGQMYVLPDVNECYHCTISQKAWIYQPWLDKLGLKMPTTTDELETVLKAFKTQDPNGNGIQDEIPWSGAVSGSWNSQLVTFIMNSFTLYWEYGNERAMYVEDDVIKTSFVQPGWKEGITYLNKLYKEGLIDPEVFTNDATKVKGLAENPDVAVMGFTQAGWPGMFLDWGGPSGRWKDYVLVPPLKGPSGLQQTPVSIYPSGDGRYIITKDCKYPEAAFRLADLMYSYEGTLRSGFGRPGIEWEASKEGAESIGGGNTAKYKILKIMSNYDQKVSWGGIAPSNRSAEFRLDWQEFNPEDPLERVLYQWSKNIYAPYGNPNLVPSLSFTADQAKQLGTLRTPLYSYMDQAFAEFVTGAQDVNTGWDQYLAKLKTLGLDQYLQIYQQAYDAKYKM